MPVISANIHVAKFGKICQVCGHFIKKGEKYLRLFGNAHLYDQPYELVQCLYCLINGSSDTKISKALEKAKIKFTIEDGYYKLDIPGIQKWEESEP
jgi:hypothetical protein